MNFGPLTSKLCLLISTYPTSTVRAFSDNFRLIAYISRIDRDIDKRKTAFTTTINSTSNAEKLVNLLSYFEPPKFNIALAVHVYDDAVAFGHVTLLRTKFQTFNCPPIGLRRRAALRWTLPHISSFFNQRRTDCQA